MDPVIDGEAKKLWLAERRTAITATDAGAILGVSKFATPLDVFLEKTGQGVDIVQTERMEAGNRMQRPIIDWWADRNEVAVVHEAPWTFRKSPHVPRVGASLDATRADDNCPIDAKNIGWKKAEWGDEGTDKIPLTYAVQLAIQMHVLDAPRAFLPVLFGGNELVGYVMERDRDLEAAILTKCVDFWETYVATGTTPPVDGSASWDDYLKRKFTTNTEVMLHGTPELHEAAAAYSVAIENVAVATSEVERLQNVLKLAIGENAGVEGPGWKATWRASKGTIGVNYEQTAKDLALQLAARTGEPATRLLAEAAAKNEGVTRKGSRRFLFSYRSK